MKNASILSIGFYLFDVTITSTIYAFASFGITGYLLASISGELQIEVWTALLVAYLCLFVSSRLYLDIRSRKRHLDQYSQTSKDIFFKFVPYLIFLPAVMSLLLSTRIQMSYHGAFHTGYITQIVHGIALPENVVLPGYNANVYWLYHALLAAIMTLLNIASPVASTIIDLFALLGSLYFIDKAVGLLGLNYRKPFVLSCYVIFILFGLNLLLSAHLTVYHLIYEYTPPVNLSDFFSRDLVITIGDLRLSNLLQKFLNFNGFPLGVMYYSSALYASIQIIKTTAANLRCLLLLVASIAGALAFHFISGMFIITAVPLSLLITLLYMNKCGLSSLTESMKLSEWMILVIAVIIMLGPLLLYIYNAALELPASSHLFLSFKHNIKLVGSSSYPLLLIFAVSVIMGFRKFSPETLFMCVLIYIGYALSLIVELPDNNQYKFVFLSTIPLCMLLILAFDYLISNEKGRIRSVGKIMVATVLSLVFINILIVGSAYMTTPWFKDRTYSYEGRQIFVSEDIDFKSAYEWIRENTSFETVVIGPLEHKNDSKVYTIAERLPYVAEGNIYGEGIPAYDRRMRNITEFFDDNINEEKKLEILGEFEKFNSERETVLLIPEENNTAFIVEYKKLQLIHSGKDVYIYKFK